jgi:predicted membrane protein
MSDTDPKDQFADRLKQRIHDEVHDRIDARMNARFDRAFRRRKRGRGGVFAGLLLAGIGALLLLQNLGVLYIDDLWEYWPVILIVVGISRAASGFGWGSRMWGGAIAAVGVVFLLHNFGVIHGNLWAFFWPVILIFVGLGMLARSVDRQGYWNHSGAAPNTSANSLDSLNEWAFFGGGRRQIVTQNFEGGEAWAIFGGINLDLRQAGTKKSEIVIEANAMFGGIDIRVPETWDVTTRGSGIFGGYEDRIEERPTDSTRPRLIITGYAVFGGVTVRN